MAGLCTLSLQTWRIMPTTGLIWILMILQKPKKINQKNSLRLLMPLKTLKKRGGRGLLSDYMRADAL